MNPKIIENKAVVICLLFEIIYSNNAQIIPSWFTDESSSKKFLKKVAEIFYFEIIMIILVKEYIYIYGGNITS